MEGTSSSTGVGLGGVFSFHREDYSLMNKGSFLPHTVSLNDLSKFVYLVGDKQNLNPMPVTGPSP